MLNLLKLKPSLPRGSFLFRLIVTNTVVFALSLIILSGINYTYTNLISEKQISETHRKLLYQTEANIETLYERVFQIGELLLNDKDVIKGLYPSGLDPSDSLILDRRLRDIVNANNFVDSVYLYNETTGRFIHTIPHDVDITDVDPKARQLVQVRNSSGKMIFLPHKQEYIYSGKRYENPILSLIFTESAAKSEYALFINLKLSALQELFDKMGNSLDSSFMIADKNGVVIARSDRPDAFLDSSASHSFLKKVIQAGEISDTFIDTMNGSKSLVTYVYNEKHEWYLVNATRYAYLTKDSFILQRNIVIISLLMLLVCLLATVFLNRRIYGPIGNVIQMVKGTALLQTTAETSDDAEYLSGVFRSLIGRVTSLEDTAFEDRKRLKESYLKDLLMGEIKMEGSVSAIMLHKHGIQFGSHPLRVFALALEGVDRSKDEPTDNRVKLVKEALFELAIRVFNEDNEMEKVEDGNHAFVLIMSDLPGNEPAEKMNAFMEQVERLMGVRLKIGIGQRVNSVHELAKSFVTAKEALAYEFIQPDESLFEYDVIQSGVSLPFRYPERLEKALFDALKLNDVASSNRILSDWFEELRHYLVADIRGALRQSVFRIENEFRVMVDFTSLGECSDSLSLDDVVSGFGTLKQVEQFYSQLAAFIIEQLKNERHRDSSVLITQACGYIDVHYRDNDLSSDSVAEYLGITAPYFSKLFNENMGVSFTHHVTSLRMKEAQSLLIETKLNVKEIGERIGFLSSSYFITVFKKNCGASPNQFRQMKKNSL